MIAASTLDTAKFRKVHALMTGGSTKGERDAARVQAGKIVARAGLTIDQAVSEMDGPEVVAFKTASFADIFGNDPFIKAQAEERKRKDAIKREEVLQRHGSLGAVFEPTEWEQALRKAVEPFAVLMPYACPSGVQRTYTSILDGEMNSDFIKGTPRIRDLIKSAIPFPTCLADALAETQAWDRLRWDRSLFVPGEWNMDAEVDVRSAMIRDFLRDKPVEDWKDMESRFAWLQYDWESQWLDPTERDDPTIDRIEADFRTLRERYEAAPVQARRRTNADKRSAVLSMLDEQPDLSDREIARRCGVSPQTVNTWRKKSA